MFINNILSNHFAAVPKLTKVGAGAPTAKSTLTLKAEFASITASGMNHASAADNKITLQLMKSGTPTPVLEHSVTAGGDVSYNFALTNIKTTSSGDYTVKVTYGSYGSVSSAAPLKVSLLLIINHSPRRVTGFSTLDR